MLGSFWHNAVYIEFLWFTHFWRKILSWEFTHFFRRFFQTEKQNPQTFLLFGCMLLTCFVFSSFLSYAPPCRSVPPQRPVMALQQQLKCPTDTVSISASGLLSHLNFQRVLPTPESGSPTHMLSSQAGTLSSPSQQYVRWQNMPNPVFLSKLNFQRVLANNLEQFIPSSIRYLSQKILLVQKKWKKRMWQMLCGVKWVHFWNFEGEFGMC